MRTLKIRSWPWFALAFTMLALAILVVNGPARGAVGFAAFVVFLGACFRGLRGTLDDLEGTRRVAERGGAMGLGGGGG